jgi:hypothetical protein
VRNAAAAYLMGWWGNAKGTMVEGAGTDGGVSKWGRVRSRELDVRVKTKTWRTDTSWAAGRGKQIPLLRDAQGRNDKTVTYFWRRRTGEGSGLYMSIDSFLL